MGCARNPTTHSAHAEAGQIAGVNHSFLHVGRRAFNVCHETLAVFALALRFAVKKYRLHKGLEMVLCIIIIIYVYIDI